MADINLYEAHQERMDRAKKSSLGFLIFSIVCVVLALGGYGGLWFWVSTKEAKIADLEAQTKTVKESLTTTSDETDQMHDLFLRLEELKKADVNIVSAKFLSEVQASMVNGVLLSGYEYDREKGKIIVSGDAVDFNALLQQVRRFRNDAAFSSAALASTGISDKGFVLFSIELGVASKQSK